MFDDTIEISIIIPVYNVEKYLSQCLDSVINQPFRQIEILCINDCSPDSSDNILSEYALKDKRITIINNEKNMGLSETRNIGLDMAKGKYIYFLDSDDYLLDNALGIMYENMEGKNLELLSFDSCVINESCEFVNNYDAKRKNIYQGIYQGYDILDKQIEKDDYKSTVWQSIYSADFLRKNNLRFFKNIYHEDELFTFEVYLKAKAVSLLSETLHVYRRREGSITLHGALYKRLEGLFVVYREAMLYAIINQTLDNSEVVTKYLDRCRDNYLGMYLKCSEEEKKCFEKSLKGYEKMLLPWTSKDKRPLIKKELSDADQQEIRKQKHIYLYGAGMAAEEWILLLNRYDIGISGILVTDLNKNRASLYGHKIIGFEEFDRDQDEYIIIPAVSGKYMDSIYKHLLDEKLNFFKGSKDMLI